MKGFYTVVHFHYSTDKTKSRFMVNFSSPSLQDKDPGVGLDPHLGGGDGRFRDQGVEMGRFRDQGVGVGGFR